MKIIAIANQKGGVAKSTTTFNLGTIKALQGKKVLMIDLDPQASLTEMCGLETENLKFDIRNFLSGKEDPYNPASPVVNPFDCGYPVLEKNGVDTLYLIPSDILLAGIEQSMILWTKREEKLKDALKAFDGLFDYIFIDCPPSLNMLTTNALVAADSVIIPSTAKRAAYRGIQLIKNTIESIKRSFGKNELSVKGFIVTMYESNVKKQQELYEKYKKEGKVLGIVRKRAETDKFEDDGLPISLAKPMSDVAEDYRAIAKKI